MNDARVRPYLLDDAVVLEFTGDHDLSTIGNIEPIVYANIGDQPRVVFDLRSIGYFDSTMLAMFLRAQNKLAERLLVVIPEKQSLKRIFEITRLDRSLVLMSSLTASLSEAPHEARNETI
jgi:anti-anti-sigma factor